jgi:DNA-binding NarL/FixJ family response regulator
VIRLAIAASTLALRTGLRSLLSGGGGMTVAAEAAHLAELEPLPADIDVLILSADAFSRGDLKRLLENATTLSVLLLADEEINAAQIFSGLRLRAWGVLLLDSTAEELWAAVSAVNEGLFVGAPSLMEPLFLGPPEFIDEGDDLLREALTGRETEVLQLLAQGLANKQIALTLGISEHTVKFHVSGIYSKMGVTNRTEAVRRGVRLGLIVL